MYLQVPDRGRGDAGAMADGLDAAERPDGVRTVPYGRPARVLGGGREVRAREQ
jgi:hypothetical protein